jgi:hypothetical protein
MDIKFHLEMAIVTLQVEKYPLEVSGFCGRDVTPCLLELYRNFWDRVGSTMYTQNGGHTSL